MKKVITIARQYGAGGRTIGLEVARQLGVALYDRDVILKTAEASNLITPEEARELDERIPRDIGLSESLFGIYSRPLSDKMWEAQIGAIRQLADKESCVIVGRNADYILREFDHILRVYLYADKEWRISHMLTKIPGATRSQIETEMHSVDKARSNYCSKHTGQTYGLADNYDLCINVGKLGIDRAAKMIIDAANEI